MFFGYNGVDKRVIYGLLILLAAYSIMSMSSYEMVYMLLSLPAVVFAISFHEFAHAYAADKFGDTTPRSQGRLTLNPIAHLDWFGFFLMMFAHIGWGKPVQIDPRNFNSNKSRGFCEMMVALAGPLMNFILAIITCILFVLSTLFLNSNNNIIYFINLFLQLFMTMNIGLGVFNLIPLPPLDGEKIFEHFLPYKAKEWLLRNYQTLYMVFMILWFFGILEIIVSPVISILLDLLVSGVGFAVTFVIGLF